MYFLKKKIILRGTISIGHCRGHDCIMLTFDFEGFYENHRRLLSKTTLDEKMGCFCLTSDKPKIKIFDSAAQGDDFECLRPHGTITLSIGKKYNIPTGDIRFDGQYENSVRIWPKHTEQRKHFLLLDRTPL